MPLGAENVFRSLTLSCEAEFAGNSIASRFGVPGDPAMQKILPDALEIWMIPPSAPIYRAPI